MRRRGRIGIVRKKGAAGDAAYEHERKPRKGAAAVDDAMQNTSYLGPAPVPFEDYIESLAAQTIRNFVVTRRNIERAFQDLILSASVYNDIGPAINSAASIFLFGLPGNGKTSIAERITRLMSEDFY